MNSIVLSSLFDGIGCDLGEFQIEVFHDDLLIDDHHYTARVFDVNKVLVSEFPATSMVDASTYFISKYLSDWK